MRLFTRKVAFVKFVVQTFWALPFFSVIASGKICRLAFT